MSESSSHAHPIEHLQNKQMASSTAESFRLINAQKTIFGQAIRLYQGLFLMSYGQRYVSNTRETINIAKSRILSSEVYDNLSIKSRSSGSIDFLSCSVRTPNKLASVCPFSAATENALYS